jgi:succinate dehydrogenase / fumarate reductase, iron-sulfur subunit
MDTAQASAITTKTVTFRIWRQLEGQEGHFEEFRIPYAQGANVISCLMEIQRNPVTADGKRVPPVVWDSACSSTSSSSPSRWSR